MIKTLQEQKMDFQSLVGCAQGRKPREQSIRNSKSLNVS
jgi:hypothetical protein